MDRQTRNRMNWNYLYYFNVLARKRSFRLAAEDLQIPNSSLTEAIQSLEKNLGCKLLFRTTRRVDLTDKGLSLFNRTKPLFESEMVLKEIQENSITNITMGFAPSHSVPARFTFTNALIEATRANKFTIRSCEHERLLKLLESGEVDVGLTSDSVKSPNLGCLKVFDRDASFYIHADLKNTPLSELLTKCRVGMFGDSPANREFQNRLSAQFPEIEIQFLFADFPSVLFDSCLNRSAIVAFSGPPTMDDPPQLVRLNDPLVSKLGLRDEQYVVWAKRIEGSLLHRVIIETLEKVSNV